MHKINAIKLMQAAHGGLMISDYKRMVDALDDHKAEWNTVAPTGYPAPTRADFDDYAAAKDVLEGCTRRKARAQDAYYFALDKVNAILAKFKL